jgi:AbrB family looped-hinge helix DNA binding protein
MAKILGASKVTVRYQVTVPAPVRKTLNLKIGDTLVFAEEDDKIFLVTQVR